MRALVLGAAGGLGRSFQSYGHRFNQKIDWTFLDRAQLDVTNAFSIATKIEFYKPDVVINCSGYTAVDKAEGERQAAFRLNSDAVGFIAEECKKKSIRFVTYSSDYVFEGKGDLPLKEKDPTNPISVYGESKLSGEKNALAYPSSIVIRTSWLYSEFGKSFPRTILEKAVQGQPLKVVNDQISSPTWSYDLVELTMNLLEMNEVGLFHFSCSGVASWWDLANKSVEIYNRIKKTELPPPEAIKTSDLNQAAKRPAYSVLNCDRIRKRAMRPRHWEVALEKFLPTLIHSWT